MPDISHKDAGFVVIVAVGLFAFLAFFAIRYANRYFDKKAPNTLADINHQIDPVLQSGHADKALTTLLNYLGFVEANPARHIELGAIFALLAKTQHVMKNAAGAFYYSELSDSYNSMFRDIISQHNDSTALIDELEAENADTKAQIKMVVPSEVQNEIAGKIRSHQNNGSVKSSADWIRMCPIPDAE